MHQLIVPILGIATVVTFSIVLLLWDLRCRRHVRSLDDFEPRIIVTGTRGKSSTVRLIHASLRAGGRRPWGRVTGTVTEEISPDNRQTLFERSGQTSIIEFLGTVGRARAARADCLVTESMAVKPELIALSQETFIRGDICVITNARADHLEDEGLDLVEIATCLAGVATGARLVITSDHDPAIVAKLRTTTESSGARFVHARGESLDPSVLARLPGEFADNVAITLAIADELGIDSETAIRGMAHTTHEPFAIDAITHRVVIDGATYTFVSLGSINDPESTRDALDSTEREIADCDWRIGIITSRWDRPLRSMEFAGFVDPEEFDEILLAGPLYRAMRRSLRRSGWDPSRIHALRWIDLRNSRTLLARLARFGLGHSNVTVVTLANVDAPVAVRFLRDLDPYRISTPAPIDGDVVDGRGSKIAKRAHEQERDAEVTR